MANTLIALTVTSPTAVLASTQASQNPASNAALWPKWRRTFRTTVVSGTQTLTYDFGSTKALTGIVLYACNFTTAQFASSPDNSTFTNLYAAAPTVPVCARVKGRRKGIFLQTGVATGQNGAGLVAWTGAFNARYLRLTMSNVLAGASYFEVGSMVAIPSTFTMTKNFGVPHNWTPREPVTRLPYAGGGSEINVDGPLRMTYDLSGPPWPSSTIGDVLSIQNLGQDGPFILYENRGDPAHIYFLKRVEDIGFGEPDFV